MKFEIVVVVFEFGLWSDVEVSFHFSPFCFAFMFVSLSLKLFSIQDLILGFLFFFLQARKALRALKGLVKLQALVRGYLVRKRAAATLHSMQALIRAQAAVRSQRARRSMTNDTRNQPETRARRSIVRIYFPWVYFSCVN